MNCTLFQDNISDYLDGEMIAREKAEFAAHRLSCRECRDLFNDVRAMMTDVNEYSTLDFNATPELEARIVEATSAGEMLSCTEFDKLIERYFDGVILGPTFQNFQAHFEECWKCRRLLRGIEEAKEMLREVKDDEVDVPQHLSRRILAATVGSEEDTFFDKLSRSLKVGQWVAAFLIFAASSMFVNFRYGSVENLANKKQEQLNQAVIDTGAMALTGMQLLSVKLNDTKAKIKARKKVDPQATPTVSPTPTSTEATLNTRDEQ